MAKKPVSRRGPSQLEEHFALQVRALKLLIPEREYRFCERRWRFDFAWPQAKVAVEIEGGVWTNGGHSRGAGYVKNLEKYNAAALLGWRLFRFHEGSVKDGSAVRMLEGLVRAPVPSPGYI